MIHFRQLFKQALVDYEGDSDDEDENEPKKTDDQVESPNKRTKLT